MTLPDDDTHDSAEISREIREGTYFKEARGWYQLLYLSPISERIYFIFIMLIAVGIMIIGILGFIYLLPIKPRIPFVYNNLNVLEKVASMHRIRDEAQSLNEAMLYYYLKEYVTMRESYSEKNYMRNRFFVKEYSEPNVFNEYNRQTHPDNPRSPIRTLGKFATRTTNIKGKSYMLGEGQRFIEEKSWFDNLAIMMGFKKEDAKRPQEFYTGVATIRFNTEDVSIRARKLVNWQADIQFSYGEFQTFDVENAEPKPGEGRYSLGYVEPTFKVLRYDLREIPDSPARVQ